MPALFSAMEALLLVVAVSIDAFVSSLAYGSNKIKIPFKSVTVINLICTSFLAVSLFLGSMFSQFIPSDIAKFASFGILAALGVSKIFDSAIKSIIKKYNKIHKKLKFRIFDLHFILNIYANPEEADVDLSRILSPIEAVYLAVALSLDGLAVGFGVGLADINLIEVILFSLICHTIVLTLGSYIGNKIAETLTINIGWLSGVILFILALSKF